MFISMRSVKFLKCSEYYIMKKKKLYSIKSILRIFLIILKSAHKQEFVCRFPSPQIWNVFYRFQFLSLQCNKVRSSSAKCGFLIYPQSKNISFSNQDYRRNLFGMIYPIFWRRIVFFLFRSAAYARKTGRNFINFTFQHYCSNYFSNVRKMFTFQALSPIKLYKKIELIYTFNKIVVQKINEQCI